MCASNGFLTFPLRCTPIGTSRKSGTRVAEPRCTQYMEIRFVSSLTIDDENRFAPALLQAIAALLRTSPLAYTIRIETTGGEVFEHQQAPSLPADTAVAAEFAAGRYDGEKNRPHRSLSARRPDRFVVPFGKT